VVYHEAVHKDQFRVLEKQIGLPRPKLALALGCSPSMIAKYASDGAPIPRERAEAMERLAANPPAAEMVGPQVLGPVREIVVSSVIDGTSNSVSIKRVGGPDQTVVVPAGSRLRVGDIEVLLPAVAMVAGSGKP